MRSLSAKLILAFALTSLAGIALAALLVRQFVLQEFDAYVLEQRRDTFVEQVQAYYTANGSWEGVAAALFPGPPPAPDGAPDDEREPHIDFVLADADGTIVISPNPLYRGRQARAEDLAGGTAITVAGQQVGTVITFGPSLRNSAELRYVARTDLALSLAGLAAVGVSLALGLLLARLITRPVRDMTAAARAIAGGDLRQHVPVRSRDELGDLAVQFNQMSADLDRANELRRRMTADIAHDLRTPLTVISGYLEALRDESLRPTQARFAAMHDETQTLLRLVEDLHTLSLADAGRLVLKRQPTPPQQLIERVTAGFQLLAAQCEVALVAESAPDLPDLDGDAEQLVRALGNLVGNALRHTPPGGGVALRAGLRDAGGGSLRGADRAGPGSILFEVADTGEGIAPEHLPNIFERFYRADEARSQDDGGSGLGLAIVKSIVEAHGGTISVASTVGQGTTFTLALPIAKSDTGGRKAEVPLLVAGQSNR